MVFPATSLSKVSLLVAKKPAVKPITSHQWADLQQRLERTLKNLDSVRRMNMHWMLQVKEAEVLLPLLAYVETHPKEDGVASLESNLRAQQEALREEYLRVREDYSPASLKVRGLYSGTEVALLYLSYLTK